MLKQVDSCLLTQRCGTMLYWYSPMGWGSHLLFALFLLFLPFSLADKLTRFARHACNGPTKPPATGFCLDAA